MTPEEVIAKRDAALAEYKRRSELRESLFAQRCVYDCGSDEYIALTKRAIDVLGDSWDRYREWRDLAAVLTNYTPAECAMLRESIGITSRLPGMARFSREIERMMSDVEWGESRHIKAIAAPSASPAPAPSPSLPLP